jgi:ribosomal protein S18 acetylase RimI-like enzyme
MDGLTFRRANPGDTNRIAEIIAGEPGQEAIGVVGNADQARAFEMAMVRLPKSPIGWERTVVTELDGEIVGIVQAGGHLGGFKISPWLVYLALHEFGPLGILRILPRFRARARVQPKTPDGAFHIAELDVAPAFRNRGIGGALLDHAEAEARESGYAQMSLTTTTINPARRLYERHGFSVIQTLTDTDYERYTGIEGRHLMVKELA